MEFSKKDIDAVLADVASLKRDLAKAISRFKDSTEDSVGEAHDFVDDIKDELAGIYKDASKRGQKTVKKMTGKVEDQPVAALLIAFGIGFVLSRLISR